MKKSSHAGILIVGGLAAAYVAYELWFVPSHVPAGYTTINAAAGLNLSSAVPANGQVAIVLPSGAHWTAAARTPSAGAAQVSVALPGDPRAPLLVTGVAAGSGLLMQWTDSNGASQATAVAFA